MSCKNDMISFGFSLLSHILSIEQLAEHVNTDLSFLLAGKKDKLKAQQPPAKATNLLSLKTTESKAKTRGRGVATNIVRTEP